MKKNGFVFAETIVVLSVVLVGLIMLYSTFSRVINREKVRTSYNQTVDIYYLNTIKEYLKAIESNYKGDGMIVPRDNGAVVNINTGKNSKYFRLECQCHDLVNEAYKNKYGASEDFCQDNYDPLYFNYCADLNNQLNVKDIYIIKNNDIRGAIDQMLADEKKINDNCVRGGVTEKCSVTVSGKIIMTPKYTGSNLIGIPRKVNATLIDYLNTLSPIKSTIHGEDWTNDYIIIGEFYRDGKYSYASLRYER